MRGSAHPCRRRHVRLDRPGRVALRRQHLKAAGRLPARRPRPADRPPGRPAAELTANLDDYFANRDVDAVKAWARIRGAATYLGALNANRPAILMANAYGDSLF